MAQPGLDTYSDSASSMNFAPPTSPVDNTPDPSTASNLLNAYQPRHAISDQLTSTLAAMPQRPIPGKLKELGASIAGAGAGASPVGIVGGQPIGFKFNPIAADQASDKVKYGDFDNKLNDWQNQVKALGIGATEEDRANAGEVTRLKNEATNEVNLKKAAIAQQRADAYTTNAETKIKEEADKHEYSMKKLNDAVAQADAKLALAKQNFELKKNSTEAMAEYHKAELASIAARREAQTENDKFKLEDQKRRTDSIIGRNKILNEATQNKTGPTTETTEVTYNKEGQATGKTVTKGNKPSTLITDPDTGSVYDTSTWSDQDKKNAAARGWK
jgi:YD repeat-containing protein